MVLLVIMIFWTETNQPKRRVSHHATNQASERAASQPANQTNKHDDKYQHNAKVNDLEI